jgi:drug/metabolite transporter (DMT)-like permease
LSWRDVPWLAAAIVAGGMAGPALLMYGLARTDAASVSLLLNLEAVFTVLIAGWLFAEHVGPRVLLGMLAIVAGGALLSWEHWPRAANLTGPLFVAAACLAWAIDNNLVRRVSGGDAATIAALKGVVAGAVNVCLALRHGATLPSLSHLAAIGCLGVVGYGVSLALFIAALRGLGAARTSAYFSVAPFFGAALSLALLGERPQALFWPAAALMAFGVWLHVTERHEHEHSHAPLEHGHEHVHDEHHRHAHDFAWDGGEPHSHTHRHAALTHRHPHYPDLHHRHGHQVE